MSADRTITLAGEDGAVEKFVVVEEKTPNRRAVTDRSFKEPFVVLFQAALMEIARESSLTWSDLRIWLACLAHASLEQPEFDSDPRLIAAELGLDPKFVSRIQGRLVRIGLLERPRRGKLALPPRIAWRGTPEARSRALKEAS